MATHEIIITLRRSGVFQVSGQMEYHVIQHMDKHIWRMRQNAIYRVLQKRYSFFVIRQILISGIQAQKSFLRGVLGRSGGHWSAKKVMDFRFSSFS